jgi:putative DNA primase/helicase
LVTGRRLYGQPFTFRPEAGHIFSVNGLPEVRDSSHGFFRRWEIIEFNRVFSQEEQVHGLDKKLISGELKEIFIWALQGARRLVAQGGYTKVSSSQEIVKDWKESTNSVELFVREMVTDDIEKLTRADVIYRAYKVWAETNGFGVLNAAKFGRRFTELVGKDRKKRDNYVHYRVGLRSAAGELIAIAGGVQNAK